MKKTGVGHILAFLTVIIWGTTFISTKVLLDVFQPVEILFFRFVLGFLALTAAFPKRLRLTDRRQELVFALAGLTGVTLYFLFENIALTYTMASNVGVIIAASPFFTALLTKLVTRGKATLGANFFVGFAAAMAGVALISFNGSKMSFNPAGDVLAVLAALVWACYSILMKRIGSYGYNTIQATRRVFAYGIVFMIPALFMFDFQLDLQRFTQPTALFNILFLGLGASALCFVSWNYAVKALGPLKTSVYIYLVPVVTVVTSVIVLKEKVTPLSAAGTALTLAGLVISQLRFGKGRSTRS